MYSLNIEFIDFNQLTIVLFVDCNRKIDNIIASIRVAITAAINFLSSFFRQAIIIESKLKIGNPKIKIPLAKPSIGGPT